MQKLLACSGLLHIVSDCTAATAWQHSFRSDTSCVFSTNDATESCCYGGSDLASLALPASICSATKHSFYCPEYYGHLVLLWTPRRASRSCRASVLVRHLRFRCPATTSLHNSVSTTWTSDAPRPRRVTVDVSASSKVC